MTRGGPRKAGPGKKMGRPAKPDKKINKNVSFRPDHIEWLEGKNASQEVEKALDLWLNKDHLIDMLKTCEPYIIDINHSAEARHDSPGEYYLDGAQYEVMKETKDILIGIKKILSLSTE